MKNIYTIHIQSLSGAEPEWPTIFPIQVLDKEPSCQIWCLSHQVKYFTNYPIHYLYDSPHHRFKYLTVLQTPHQPALFVWGKHMKIQPLLQVCIYGIVNRTKPPISTTSGHLCQKHIHIRTFIDIVQSFIDSFAAEFVLDPKTKICFTTQDNNSISSVFFLDEPRCPLIICCMLGVSDLGNQLCFSL